MRPIEDIKKLIKDMEDKTSAEMDKRILSDALGTLDNSKTITPIRIIIMKRYYDLIMNISDWIKSIII